MDPTDKFKARLIYTGLFLISLGIPFLHYAVACDAMRTTRRINFGLTSAPFLFVNWFGETSTIIPAILFMVILVSWKRDRVLRSDVLWGITLAMLAFATAYGTYCCHLLSGITTDYVKLVIEKGR
ncbi:MAG: hypothetical protein WCJ02_14720 [bacterium]